MANLLYFLLMTKISLSLGKYLRQYEKCHGLLGNELLLTRCQPLQIQDLVIFVSAIFFIFPPSKSHER